MEILKKLDEIITDDFIKKFYICGAIIVMLSGVMGCINGKRDYNANKKNENIIIPSVWNL